MIFVNVSWLCTRLSSLNGRVMNGCPADCYQSATDLHSISTAPKQHPFELFKAIKLGVNGVTLFDSFQQVSSWNPDFWRVIKKLWSSSFHGLFQHICFIPIHRILYEVYKWRFVQQNLIKCGNSSLCLRQAYLGLHNLLLKLGISFCSIETFTVQGAKHIKIQAKITHKTNCPFWGSWIKPIICSLNNFMMITLRTQSSERRRLNITNKRVHQIWCRS